MGGTMSDWQPEPRPVPVELEAGFPHAVFPPPTPVVRVGDSELARFPLELVMELGKHTW